MNYGCTFLPGGDEAPVTGSGCSAGRCMYPTHQPVFLKKCRLINTQALKAFLSNDLPGGEPATRRQSVAVIHPQAKLHVVKKIARADGKIFDLYATLKHPGKDVVDEPGIMRDQ